MNTIADTVFQKLAQAGLKARTVSITRLPAVQGAVARLVKQELIAAHLHHDWHFYLGTSKDLPDAKTIFVVAIPQPVARAWFEWRGISYPADFPSGTFVKADETRAGEILSSALKTAGYRVAKAHLALKTLAVRSGLARYGKNNITYVPGVGSYHRLVAFYADCPCEVDSWQDYRVIEACNGCSLCREKCPAGSIKGDRFLIRAENCKAFGEMEKDASWWAHPENRDTLTGCMICQFVCPANRMYRYKSTDGPFFSAVETESILNAKPWRELPPETLVKLDRLACDETYPVLARNLRTLIDVQKR